MTLWYQNGIEQKNNKNSSLTYQPENQRSFPTAAGLSQSSHLTWGLCWQISFLNIPTRVFWRSGAFVAMAVLSSPELRTTVTMGTFAQWMQSSGQFQSMSTGIGPMLSHNFSWSMLRKKKIKIEIKLPYLSLYLQN